MGSIAQLCSRALLLKHGSIILNSNVDHVIQNYSSELFDLKTYKSHSKKYEISIVEQYCSTNSNLVNDFKFHESIDLNFILEHNHYIDGVVLSFSVYDEIGTIIFTTHQEISSFQGRKSYKCTLPSNLLLPGNYTMCSFLHLPNVRYIDCEPNFIGFTIMDTGHEHSIYDKKYGLISVPVVWN
jgi:hypothetical protein